MTFPFEIDPPDTERPALGLVVLQSDETIEREFRTLLPPSVDLFVSRVPSGADVTAETLAAMRDHLASAAGLFPQGRALAAVGYACTSGASVIGSGEVARLIRDASGAVHVTDPVASLVAACRRRDVRRLALLSPYVEEVSETLRVALAAHGIETSAFGSFGEARERTVARITTVSIVEAATGLLGEEDVDGLFLSCTNLRTLDAIDRLGHKTRLPILSSNTVLAEELLFLAGRPNETERTS